MSTEEWEAERQRRIDAKAAEVREVLRRRPKRQHRPINPLRIVEIVADYYHVPADEILGDRRDRHIAIPRQVAYFIARRHGGMTYQRLGQIFNRDHATVIHGAVRMATASNRDPVLTKQIRELEAAIDQERQGRKELQPAR